MGPATGHCVKEGFVLQDPRDGQGRSAHLLPCRGGEPGRWAGVAQGPLPCPALLGSATPAKPGCSRDSGSPFGEARGPHCRGPCGSPAGCAPTGPSFVCGSRALAGAPAPSRGGLGLRGGAQKGGRASPGSPPGLGQVASPAGSLVYHVPGEETLLPDSVSSDVLSCIVPPSHV